MKRRIGLLLAAAVVSTVGILGASPAQAHTTVCAGNGTATLSTGFSIPTTWRTANFSFSLNTGACADGSSLSATGTVNGACGESSGYGITNSGHVFTFVSTGGTLYVTGQVTGQVTVIEDPNDANSCLNGNAIRFLITGSATLTHTASCSPHVVATVKANLNIYGC